MPTQSNQPASVGRPLTVGELIGQLSLLDPDLPVACRYDGSQETGAGPLSLERLEVVDLDDPKRTAHMDFAVIGEVDGYELNLWMREKSAPVSPPNEA